MRGELLDRLDVADLESEAEHGYALFWATQVANRVHEAWVGERGRADGEKPRPAGQRLFFRLEQALDELALHQPDF